jgi:uncharacterized protein (DUF1697 family)
LEKVVPAIGTGKPMTLVVFLRGVNVGGHKTFRPKQLAEQLKHLDIVNIGAAGTFVVRKKTSQTEVREALERLLPFRTQIVICRGRDILALVSNDPFSREKKDPRIVRFVSVLAKKPRVEPAYPLVLPRGGPWLVKLIGRRERFVLGMYRRHMKTIRYLGTTDDEFHVPVTTRNWNTITAIANVLRGGTSSPKNGGRHVTTGKNR